MKREKEKLSDDGQSNYMPIDEWKCLELEKNKSNQTNLECIGEYGLMIDDDDFEYMCDYLLSKDEPFTVSNEARRLEEKKCKLIGTPQEQINGIEHEFDIWVRTNRFIGLSDEDATLSSMVVDTVYPNSMDMAY
ncbi:hypothetical protein Tco_0356822 [Tanacetum coccineum]